MSATPAIPHAPRLTRPALGWLALGGSVGGWLALSMVFHQPFHVGARDLRFFDLRVYRGAAVKFLGDRELYSRPIIRHLGFTYPPAAALLLVPLALLPFHVDRLLVTAVNVGMLVWMVHSTLRLTRHRAAATVLWSVAAGIAAFALWLEPITTTLGYGQIDLVIAALVMFDLARSDDAPLTGVAIGIAAGVKLTPLVFIVFLALSGRRRSALRAAVAFAGTIALSFAVAGGDAARYWGGLIFDSRRVGGAGDAANQSLRGALARLTHTPHPGAAAELIIAVVAVIGLTLAVRAVRRGQPQLGVALTIITTLLISPVSWTHHWTLAVPALILLGARAFDSGRAAWLLAGVLAIAVGYAYLPELFMGGNGLTYGVGSLAEDSYVLVGLAVLAIAGGGDLRDSVRRRRARRPQVPPAPC